MPVKTEAAAQEAVDTLRLVINQQTPRQQLHAISLETLVQHYREHEMPDVFRKTQPRRDQQSVEVANRKSYATQETYEGYLKKWILPRWRSYHLGDVKAVQVEQWLRLVPLAQGSRAKIRNIMSALYTHAIRWEWTNRNPITAVRQSGKRSKSPTILTIEQIQALLEHLDEPCRTMVLLDASTGLRIGELLGLKWEDVNFKKFEISVTRSVVKQNVGPCKTEASQKPIPLDAALANRLWQWRLNTRYNRPEDWVFASPHKRGTQPYWPGTLFRVHLKPKLKAANISGNVDGTRCGIRSGR